MKLRETRPRRMERMQKERKMMKKLTALALALWMLISVSGCGGASAPSQEETTPPDLTGVWRQVDSQDEDFYQQARIQGDVIEIYWVDTSMGEETVSLYWYGTFTPPETGDKTYTWESQRDKEKTDLAILASTDDTKTFTYTKGQLSYEVSVQGETGTVRLEQVEDSEFLADQGTSEVKEEVAEEIEYGLGDTWTVEGLWSLTVTGVEEVAERSEYADENPAVVYRVSYSYTNLGYESDIWEGLYIDLGNSTIVDSAGKVGRPYYYGDAVSPLETPVGATCDAQACIGLDNAGDFTLTVTEYDDSYEEYSATFRIPVSGETPAPAEGAEGVATTGQTQTGGTVTLNGINLVLPDYATYEEVEAGVSGLITLEENFRQASVVATDMGSFDESNYDLLNQMTIAAILEGTDYTNEEGYTVTVGGETAQTVLCNVSGQTWVLLAFIHGGIQYSFLYIQAPGANGDSSDFTTILENVSFEA